MKLKVLLPILAAFAMLSLSGCDIDKEVDSLLDVDSWETACAKEKQQGNATAFKACVDETCDIHTDPQIKQSCKSSLYKQ